MLDKFIDQKKYIFEAPNKSDNIHIKLFSDLHYCGSFDDRKLDKIEETIRKTSTDYICIVGDILDSTIFLKSHKEKRLNIMRWLEKLGRDYKVFISLGSHDFSCYAKKEWREDWQSDFWKEISNLPGIQLSHYNTFYEDEKVIINLIEPNYEYYYNESKYEKKEILIKELKKQKKYLTNLDNKKVKILMNHSPILMNDYDVLKLIEEYDFIFSGHMHNGMLLPIIDKLIKNNIGIIAPNKSLFPDNARGIKTMEVDGKTINLIITGGIIKLAECTGILEKFNCFYPMEIDEININVQKKVLK